MKNVFTLRHFILTCLGLITASVASVPALGQFNWATTANFIHSTPPPNPGPPYTYGSYHYNDGHITPYPALQTANIVNLQPDDYFTYVPNGGWIKIWWNFPAAVGGQINKIVFYKDVRPMTSCKISHFDLQTQTWVQDTVYNNIYNNYADSIILTTPLPVSPVQVAGQWDTIMIHDIQYENGNPSFREIQLFNMPACGGPTVAPTIVAGSQTNAPTAGPTNPILSTCPGYTCYFQATSAATEWGHNYQWQINTGSGWADIPGEHKAGYTHTFTGLGAQFRVWDTCVATGAFAVSNDITVTVTPNYVPIPAGGYYMGFDNFPWPSSTCLPAGYTADMPGPGWSASPPIGFNTARLDSGVNVNPMNIPSNYTTSYNSGWFPSTTQGNYNYDFTYPYNVKFPLGQRRSARFRSGSNSFQVGTVGNLDLYLDASQAGDKALFFYYRNPGAVNYDSLRVLLSTNAGQTWTQIGSYDSAQRFKKRVIPIQTTSPTSIIRFQVYKYGTEGSPGTDIGIDSVFIAPQCTSTPVAGKIYPNGTMNVCAGTTINLTALGQTQVGGLVWEWQHMKDGVNWLPVNGGQGSNNLFFTTPPVYDTVFYRLMVKCGPTGTPVFTDTLKVFLSSAGPTYASLPYRQNFETWVNKCGTGDVPAGPTAGVVNWANNPFSGNASWRVDNTTTTASGWSTLNGAYIPTSAGLARSARFHSNGAFTNQKGNLDLLFNGSTSTGNKELRFYYLNTSGNDSFDVFYSTDAGSNFTKLAGYKNNANWTQYALQVPCNTQNCVIRFQGSGESGNQSDIGLDSVTIAPPCTGMPNGGTLSFANPCPGVAFTTSLQGFSTTGGLIFTWEQSTDSVFWGPTSPPNPTSATFLNTSINQDTWFRVIVTCPSSGLKDTVIRKIIVSNFYYCYCGSGATSSVGADIGNVNIKKLPAGTNVLNNGSATPQNNNAAATGTYSDFRKTIAPVPIYHDSLYQLIVSQINSGNFTAPGTTVTAWIDTDRNGIFDVDEVFLQKNSVNTSNPPQRVDTTIQMPATTPVGITGMRIVMEDGTNVISTPCGTYSTGETEDYLVDIRYHPCTGPTNAGIAHISDTAACANYTVTLVDTTHERERHGIRWVWQYSPDSNSWADINGSLFRDTVNHVVTSQTYYRLQMICLMTFDTTYSNVVKVVINPPYACYCFSLATGGPKDTSDIGGFSFHTMTVPSSGPHLLNPWAVNSRTDWTKEDTIHLWVDSTYELLIFHTMLSPTHGDAKVTVFMDLNNDLLYNITNTPFTERLYTGFTTSSTFTLVHNITIPPYAIPNVLTGMRVILNNDTGPNAPSDSACGPYFSGETEDFVVMFHKQLLEVNDPGMNTTMNVYPNPTEGRFTVMYDAKNTVAEATLTVTNITGQQIIQKHYVRPGRRLSEEIDLTRMARGVYMVELRADNERHVKKLIVK